MKKLLHFIMAFLLVAALGGGCSRGGGEAGLVAIDSLIAASPDSALAALGRIDTAALGEGGRAYHALLTVQAHYAAYDPATDSTDICRAWRWYAHHGPADRQLRAMRYRGIVAEEMGDSIEAMRWYKRTVLADSAGDGYDRAIALKQMGILYQLNGSYRKAVDKFRQAMGDFENTHKRQRLFCCQQLSQLYQQHGINKLDSARHFNRASMALASELADSATLAVAKSTQVQLLFYSRSFAQAKDAAVEAIRSLGAWSTFDCWHFASQSYAAMHHADSAEYYAVNAPAPSTAADSTMYCHSLALVSELRGEWDKAHRLEQASEQAAGSVLRSRNEALLIEAENSVTVDLLDEKSRTGSHLADMLKALLALLALAFIVSAVINYFRHKKREDDLKSERDKANKSQQRSAEAVKELNVQIEKLKEDCAAAEESRQQSDNEIKRLISQIEDVNQRITFERENAKRHILTSINKVRRAVEAGKKSEAAGKTPKSANRIIQVDESERQFWRSELSSELLSEKSREFFERIAARCELSDTEVMVLKLVALDLSDEEIRLFMGSNRDDYSRVVMSRIKNKAGLDQSIRKTFRKLNGSS